MGWVSYSEDIEEIRAERTRVLMGYDSFLRRLSASKSLSDVKRAETDLERLIDHLTKLIEFKRAHAISLFDEIEELFKSRNVQISKKIDKKTDQLSEARLKLKETEIALTECRNRRDRIVKERTALLGRNAELEDEIQRLRDNEVAWQSAMTDVKPLRR
jgi:chromosome segregation ATPase